MPALVVEAECLAAVLMGSGNELGLLKRDGNTISTNLDPSLGRLVRGKRYRVTFEEIEPWAQISGSG
jgi:hypothetical protein